MHVWPCEMWVLFLRSKWFSTEKIIDFLRFLLAKKAKKWLSMHWVKRQCIIWDQRAILEPDKLEDIFKSRKFIIFLEFKLYLCTYCLYGTINSHNRPISAHLFSVHHSNNLFAHCILTHERKVSIGICIIRGWTCLTHAVLRLFYW